jgi:DNA-directed RNA polymerase subunit RPC12/RpoP
MAGGDKFDEFLEYDVGMGGGVVECPACGAKVPYSVLIDDEAVCPKCGNKIRIDGNGSNEGDDIDDDSDDEEDEK